MGERHPDLRPQLETDLAVAVDGEVTREAWLRQIAGDSAVLLFPKIAGGKFRVSARWITRTWT